MKEYLLGATEHYNRLSLKQREQLNGYHNANRKDEEGKLGQDTEDAEKPGADEQVAGI